MTAERTPVHTRTWQIAITTCLILTTALTAINHVALFRLKENVERWSQTSADVSQMSLLTERMSSLEQHVAELHRGPAPLTEVAFEESRVAIDARLRTLEQEITASANATERTRADLQALNARLSKAQRPEARSSSVPPAAVANADPDIPPFKVLSTEVRGGELFVSLMPQGSHSLADVRLLRVGEAQDNWRLVEVGSAFAVFQLGDRRRRVELP